MPVISYIPPKKEIKDHRSNDGNFYLAKCDLCGTEFYPKRNNAKYCSTSCMKLAYRTRVAEMKKGGVVPKKKEVTQKAVQETPTASEKQIKINGWKNVYGYIKEKYSTYGEKDAILNNLKELEVGKSYRYYKITVYRYGTMSYGVVDSTGK